MKAPFSPFLTAQADGLKRLIGLLKQDHDFVSVLATDSRGLAGAWREPWSPSLAE